MASLEERYIMIRQIIGNSKDIRTNDMISLLDHLDNDTEWLKSPASTKYHGSYEGGLIEHSINVAETAIRIGKVLAPEIDISILAFIGLVHDVGKIGMYIQKEPTEKQIQYGFPGSIHFIEKINRHNIRSLQIIGEYVHLTEDEFIAIQYHNSPWDGNKDCAFYKNKLMTILQNADYWSTIYLENGGAKNE